MSPVRTSASGPPAAASGATCRTTVPYAVPLIRPSQIRTMSRTPCCEQLGRQRHVRRPRACPGSPSARSRAAPAPSRRRRRGPGRRCGRAGPRCCRRRPPGRGACSSSGEAAAGLMTAPSGARLPRSTAMPASGSSGAVAGPDDLGVPDLRVVEVVDQRPAGDGERVGSSRSRDLAQHGEQPAGPVEVLHQEPAGRLQVDQQRHAGADRGRSRPGSASMPSRPAMASRCTTALVEPPIAASATIALWNEPAVRKVLGPAVLRRPARRPAGRSRARPPAAGCPGPGCRPGRAGRCRAPRPAGHRRGGAHRVAVAAAADHRRLGLEERLARTACRPRTSSREPPHVGAAAERHAAEGAGEHRPAGHDHGRQVDRGRGHQQRRDRLVAAAEQHDAVDRVGPQHLLGRHRGHVAPEHRGRPDLRLAERHDRQVQRDAAGLVDALLDAARRPR